MHRSLLKTAAALTLFLTFPILCFAWTAPPGSREFDNSPGLSDSSPGSAGDPATTINVPAGAPRVPPAVSTPKPLYLPNVARDRGDSQTPKTGIARLLSFLRPSKADLDRYFKGEDDSFRDRGKSASDPFKKRDWK